MLRPLDVAPIVESVRRTGRLVFVDTGYMTFGIGAEVACRITEACFDALKAPPRRLGLPDHPTPSSRALAEAYYPRSSHIAAAVMDRRAMSIGIRPFLRHQLPQVKQLLCFRKI